MPQRYQTVLFDFGGTLDSDGVAWKERVHGHYRAEGLAMSAADFAPAFYAADDRLVGTIPQKADLAATVGVLTGNLKSGFAEPGTAPDKARGERAAARFMSRGRSLLYPQPAVPARPHAALPAGRRLQFLRQSGSGLHRRGLGTFLRCDGRQQPYWRRKAGPGDLRSGPAPAGGAAGRLRFSSAIHCAATAKAPGVWAWILSGSRRPKRQRRKLRPSIIR